MKKIFTIIFIFGAIITNAHAYKLVSSKELGRGDAKNQNIVVQCTTDTGKISKQTCKFRRYVKCKKNKCSGWQPWKDLQNPRREYNSWRNAASDCCKSKGLR